MAPEEESESPKSGGVTPVVPTTIDVTQAGKATPDKVPVSGKDITHIYVGFQLAQIVLRITAGAIILFVLYLFAMDWIIGIDVRDAYRKILSPSRVGAEFLTLAQPEKFSDDLTAARKNSTPQWTTEAQQNAQNLLKLVDEIPSVPNDQKAELKNCAPPPPASEASRDSKLDSCLHIASGIRQAALEAVAASTDAKVAGDAAGKIGEQRQNLHTFWVQAAQLVLLNLLLPLLTALFGYIFGTQQAQKEN